MLFKHIHMYLMSIIISRSVINCTIEIVFSFKLFISMYILKITRNKLRSSFIINPDNWKTASNNIGWENKRYYTSVYESLVEIPLRMYLYVTHRVKQTGYFEIHYDDFFSSASSSYRLVLPMTSSTCSCYHFKKYNDPIESSIISGSIISI